MRFGWIALMVLAMLATTTPTSAQSLQSQDSEPDILDDVSVTGRDPRRIRAFIDGLTTPGPHGSIEGQIARWDDPVCVRVIGGWHAVNVAMADRISEMVRSLNIQTGDDGCRPNVMVVVAENPDGFAQVFADRYRIRFFDNRRAEIAAFIAPPRAIRWQHRTGTGVIDGSPLIDAGTGGRGGEAAALPNTRLRRSTTEKITRAVVVIDPERVSRIPTASLVGYVAFVLLVDLKPFPDTGGNPSILNLFDESPEGTTPAGLTAWDRAFVEGVYAMSTDRRFGVQQSQIERSMRRSMTGSIQDASAEDVD